MQPSQNAIELIKASEGLRLTAYRDSAGILTIGYGSTGGIKPGQKITPEQAEAMLVDDLDEAADAVRKLVTVPLTQGQFDALCSFVFNLGAGRLRDSTLLRLLNQGKYGEAAAQFRFWVMAGGKPLPGLVKRRAAERALFEGATR
jgi:lysozyme